MKTWKDMKRHTYGMKHLMHKSLIFVSSLKQALAQDEKGQDGRSDPRAGQWYKCEIEVTRRDLKRPEVTWVITWNDSLSGSTCSIPFSTCFFVLLPKASGRIVPLGAAAKRRFLCCPRFSQLEKNPYNLKFYLHFFTISFSICFFKLW